MASSNIARIHSPGVSRNIEVSRRDPTGNIGDVETSNK
jgi:hypothetical protein